MECGPAQLSVVITGVYTIRGDLDISASSV